jgi:predicted dehydrogenase
MTGTKKVPVLRDKEKILVIGAGSAGCHLARAAEMLGFQVNVTDNDTLAYARFCSLYEQRYDMKSSDIGFKDGIVPADYYFIATPPDTHLAVAKEICKVQSKANILVEKPLCLPGEIEEFDSLDAAIFVNYNHMFSPTFKYFQNLKLFTKDEPKIEVRWQESKDYIMSAHPWLAFDDSYLSDASRGGGSAYEHSHGLALALAIFPLWSYENILCNKTMNGKYDESMTITLDVMGVAVESTTDFTSEEVTKSIFCKRGEHVKAVRFDDPKMDICKFTRNGGSGEIGRDKSRNLEFQRSIFAAMEYWSGKADQKTYEIAKKVVQILGEAHAQ